jgi:predicted GNAT family N-acyltransferase
MSKRSGKLNSTAKKLSRVSVKRVFAEKDLALAYAIRIRVFVKEQGVPSDIELDDDDQRAIHFLASVGAKAVGTARVVWHRGAVKIGRMAVLKSYRRRGVGRRLLTRAVAVARGLKARRIYLHAQVAVSGFYERLNFRGTGATFDEAGIAHRKMIWRGRLSGRQRRVNKH